MISPDIAIIIGLMLIIFTYETYVRSYSKGFKDGLEMGKKLGRIDTKLESERVEDGKID